MACFIEDGQRQTALACAPILICGRQRRADNSGSSSVSPKLRDLYRKGAMNLEQLSAFAITEDHGSVRIERGFVRAEDEPESKPKDESKGKRPAKAADGLAPLSEKLVAELTAYRTSALRNELAQHPGRRSSRSFTRSRSRPSSRVRKLLHGDRAQDGVAVRPCARH